MGITMLYITWRRASPPFILVDRAVRQCSSKLARYVDRTANAESYHECLDLLASIIVQSIAMKTGPVVVLGKSAQEGLCVLVRRVEQNGAAPYIIQMLREIIATSSG